LIKQTVSDSFIRLKNTLKILDFGFSTLVRKGPVAVKELENGQVENLLKILLKKAWNRLEFSMVGDV
jgi:hypothetical protein